MIPVIHVKMKGRKHKSLSIYMCALVALEKENGIALDREKKE